MFSGTYLTLLIHLQERGNMSFYLWSVPLVGEGSVALEEDVSDRNTGPFKYNILMAPMGQPPSLKQSNATEPTTDSPLPSPFINCMISCLR